MSSQNELLIDLYRAKASVFTIKGIALTLGSVNDRGSIKNKLNYYVKKGGLLNPRKGIYAKPGYDVRELACLLYTPSYISLEYILQRAGIIFQYSSAITSVGTLSRTVDVDGTEYSYRKIKGEILVNRSGIFCDGNVNVATPERAFLDVLYLSKNYYFDNIDSLNRDLIFSLLPVYGNKSLEKRVRKILR